MNIKNIINIIAIANLMYIIDILSDMNFMDDMNRFFIGVYFVFAAKNGDYSALMLLKSNKLVSV